MPESMRGSRLGAVSYENEGGVDFAPRQLVPFDCPNGHAFAVPFSVEADLPPTWECRVCGSTAARRDGVPAEGKGGRKPRTPWDMLLERRSIDDLEVLLEERLTLLRDLGGPTRADHPDHRKTA
jgi:RNA polymerase-binding protein